MKIGAVNYWCGVVNRLDGDICRQDGNVNRQDGDVMTNGSYSLGVKSERSMTLNPHPF